MILLMGFQITFENSFDSLLERAVTDVLSPDRQRSVVSVLHWLTCKSCYIQEAFYETAKILFILLLQRRMLLHRPLHAQHFERAQHVMKVLLCNLSHFSTGSHHGLSVIRLSHTKNVQLFLLQIVLAKENAGKLHFFIPCSCFYLVKFCHASLKT